MNHYLSYMKYQKSFIFVWVHIQTDVTIPEESETKKTLEAWDGTLDT